jgi:TPR repeat protein
MNKLIVILILLASSNAHAQVYKCVKNNNVSYSDKPCNGNAIINTLSSSSDLKEGLSAYELGNFDIAYKKLSPLSVKGDAMAQNTLGRMYMQGSGVTKDFNEAFSLFQKAAGKGLPNAQSNLGVLYASGEGVKQDYKLSIDWFKKAADQGYKLAMLNLAGMYEKGYGTYPDKVEAAKWRNKANGLEVTKDKDLVKVETVGNSCTSFNLI